MQESIFSSLFPSLLLVSQRITICCKNILELMDGSSSGPAFFVSLLPCSLSASLLSLFAHVYVLSLINTSSFCVFDCLGHAGNFCFLLSASPGAMCAQRQNGFQRRLRPHLRTRCRHPIEGHSVVTRHWFSRQPGD